MYVRPQNYRYPHGTVRLPQNYGGSAFSAKQDESTEEADLQSEYEASTRLDTEEIQVSAEAKEDAPSSPVGFKLRLPSFLGDKIGSEELLIIALIILLADGGNGGGDNTEIITLLVLLLFLK